MKKQQEPVSTFLAELRKLRSLLTPGSEEWKIANRLEDIERKSVIQYQKDHR